MADTQRCDQCSLGLHFIPRADEIERYGPNVMGCKRPNWEGYTHPDSTCEAFCQLLVVPEIREISQ